MDGVTRSSVFTIPEEKTGYQNYQHSLKIARHSSCYLTNRWTSDKKANFMLDRGAAPGQKLMGPTIYPSLPSTRNPPLNCNQSKPMRMDALKKLGIKQYYLGSDNQGESSRDKWVEKNIAKMQRGEMRKRGRPGGHRRQHTLLSFFYFFPA